MGAVASMLWLAAEARPRCGRMILAGSIAWMGATLLALVLDVAEW